MKLTKTEKLFSSTLRYGSYGFAAFAAMVAGTAIASAATLTLSPSSGTHAAETTFEVKVELNTSSVTTSGTDAYIRFDPNVLQVVDASPGTDGVQILPGTLYSQTSFNSVDNTTGKISFSGSKSGGSAGYSGSGTLATITFQAVKESGSTPVAFDFTSGSTTDSNVINQADSSDALTSVSDASYTITAAAGTTTDDGSSDDGSSGDDGSGAAGTGGTDGSGGSTEVAGTGIDLRIYMVLTVLSLIGAAYFLTRKHPKHR